MKIQKNQAAVNLAAVIQQTQGLNSIPKNREIINDKYNSGEDTVNSNNLLSSLNKSRPKKPLRRH